MASTARTRTSKPADAATEAPEVETAQPVQVPDAPLDTRSDEERAADAAIETKADEKDTTRPDAYLTVDPMAHYVAHPQVKRSHVKVGQVFKMDQPQSLPGLWRVEKVNQGTFRLVSQTGQVQRAAYASTFIPVPDSEVAGVEFPTSGVGGRNTAADNGIRVGHTFKIQGSPVVYVATKVNTHKVTGAPLNGDGTETPNIPRAVIEPTVDLTVPEPTDA